MVDIALPGAIQFWNSKSGDEGYTTRPLSRYADQVQEWAHGFVVGSGRKCDMLVWQAGESGLEPGMAECLASTTYGQVARPPPGRREGVPGREAHPGLMVGAVAEHCSGSAVCHWLDSPGGHRPHHPPRLDAR